MKPEDLNLNPGDVWVKPTEWQYRQVLRVEDGNIHWRNLGGKDRVSTLKNFAKWMDGARLLNLDGDVPFHVLKNLGAKWPSSAFYFDCDLVEVCELDGRYYMGRYGSDYSPISKKFYDAFVEEFGD